jgi:hypothetical protein
MHLRKSREMSVPSPTKFFHFFKLMERRSVVVKPPRPMSAHGGSTSSMVC